MGCFEIFSPKDGLSKITKQIGHPVVYSPPPKIHSTDRIDLNLYFDMKKITDDQIIIDGNRAVGKLWLFLPLFGYNESDSRKSAQKGPKNE